jgi:hypothetical protein
MKSRFFKPVTLLNYAPLTLSCVLSVVLLAACGAKVTEPLKLSDASQRMVGQSVNAASSYTPSDYGVPSASNIQFAPQQQMQDLTY